MNKGERLIKKPTYVGGKKAMTDFIKANVKYPKQAIPHKVEGVVSVFIDINEKGTVVRVKAKKKIGHGCDEEAMRVAKLLKFHVDSKRKMKMTFHKTINITFKVPKKKAKPKPVEQPSVLAASTTQSMQIVYTYVPSKKKS